MSGAPREKWNSRTGFVLAAIGSAVGLGNMWRFSYLAAEHGGAAFVVLYLGFTLLVGVPVLLAEMALGRGARRSPIAALEHYGGRSWRGLGALFVVSGFVILAYYSVIAGWTFAYAISGLTGFGSDPAATFAEVSTGPDAVAWHLAFMALVVTVVIGGVRGGIERAAVFLMPALLVLLVGLALYASGLEGSGEGYRRYLSIDVSAVFDRDVMVQAAGQAFFSLSLGMGAMLTFASYVGRDTDLKRDSLVISASDFGVAFLAGLVVFPLIFAFGLEAQVGDSTLGALFITLPAAFAEMGAAGRVVGTLFFVGLAVGALTSAVSLLEVVVSTAIDSLGLSRRRATLFFGSVTALLGIPAALDIEILGLMDQVAGNFLLVLGGFLLAVFVGWRMPDPVAAVLPGAASRWGLGAWRGLLRYVVPPILLWVLWGSAEATLAAVGAVLG